MLNRAYYVAILMLLLLSPMLSFAQKEGNIWYFGVRAGLDFNTLPPTILTDGQVNTREGVATVADANGKLLFYTEGTVIWDANHQVMPNGSDLRGSYTASQSTIAVPFPGHPGQYYVFTTATENGLLYSLVDMTLHGGKGDVVLASKNTQLLSRSISTEKVMAAKHCNNKDFWIISHSRGDNKFYVYPLTVAGIGTPQVYALGQVITDDTGWETIGCLKVSPDGQWLTHVKGNKRNTTNSYTELFHFSNQTGAITGPVAILDQLDQGYGMEYSPDGKLIYVTATNGRSLYQYDLAAADINASRVTISISQDINYGSLQLAADRKIYVAGERGYDASNYALSIINDPNVKGSGCNFVENAITLASGGAKLGLPTLMGSYFYHPENFIVKDTCLGAVTSFSISNTTGITTVKWDFGDGNTSPSFNPTHTYAAAGPYTVTLQITGPCNTATFTRVVQIMKPDHVSEEKLICNGSDYTLPDGRVVHTSGNYTSTLKNIRGCDSVITTKLILAQPYSGREDAEICAGTTYTLPDGRIVSLAGTYVSNLLTWQKCDSVITTTLKVLQNYDITEEVIICAGQDFTLPDGSIVNATGSYLSSLLSVSGCDSSITTKLTVAPDYHTTEKAFICTGTTYQLPDGRKTATAGTYISTFVSIYGCDSIITTSLTVYPDFHITENIALCPGSTYKLPDGRMVTAADTYISNLLSIHGCDSIITTIMEEALSYVANDQQEICDGTSYTLQDGTQITQTGDYTVKYSTYLGCDSIFNTHLQVNDPPVIELGPDTCLFNNKPIIISPGAGFSSYRWQNGATTPNFTIYQPGAYWVEVSNDCGTARDGIQATVCSPDIFVPNVFTPNGDGLNDIFRIVNYHGQQLQDFSIFNRWGELIFRTTNPAAGWNGTYRNVPQPVGSYVYMIRYHNMDGVQHLLKGTVTLAR